MQFDNDNGQVPDGFYYTRPRIEGCDSLGESLAEFKGGRAYQMHPCGWETDKFLSVCTIVGQANINTGRFGIPTELFNSGWIFYSRAGRGWFYSTQKPVKSDHDWYVHSGMITSLSCMKIETPDNWESAIVEVE